MQCLRFSVCLLSSLLLCGLPNPAKADPTLNLEEWPQTIDEPNFGDNIPSVSNIQSLIAQDASEAVGDTFNPQEIEKLRQELRIDPITREKIVYPPSPGSTLGVPTAFGANWGNAYIGGAFASSTRTTDSADGSMSLGMGFGNARKAIGVEATLGIISLQDSFGEDGIFGLKIHRMLDSEGNFAIAVGWENIIKWGDAQDTVLGGGFDTIYGVVSGRFELQSEQENQLPLTLSVGLGSGRFRSQGAIDAEDQTVGVFASAGLKVIPQISLITTWTGQELNMGVSFAPFNQFPLIINLGAADVTSVFPQGTRFIMTAGYAINF